MIMSFKKLFPWGKPANFKEKILTGIKIHSIREDKTGRWKPGVLTHMAYGVRTKFYECFCDKHKCKSTQEIRIEWSRRSKHFVTVFIDKKFFYSKHGGIVILNHGMIELAKNDGFDSIEDFFRWFHSDFKGVIIHWTDFKY